jgi:hypothetical protein
MTPKAEPKTRNRRTADQIVADLQAEIDRVKARAAVKEAKARPEAQPLILAVRALDKAGRAATETGNKEIVAALDSARAALAPAIVGLGLRIPEKTKRGRKRKGEAA